MEDNLIFNLGPTHSAEEVEVETFWFKKVEETPLLEMPKAAVLSVVAFGTLLLGVGINFRIYRLLVRRKNKGGTSAIDKLCLVNSIISLIGHPPLLVSLPNLHVMKVVRPHFEA
jgi:hypothetical protein